MNCDREMNRDEISAISSTKEDNVDIREADASSSDSSKALVTSLKSSGSQDIVDLQSGQCSKSQRIKAKPARVQVDPSTIDEEKDRPPQTGTVFNIWYQKWSGGDKEDAYLSQRKADGRCNIERDSGYTKADKVPGSYFCLYFARGLCTKGRKCEYLHRLPTVTDMFAPNVDCFGRDRFSDYRDDMGGVGSFLRQNRTLYVGKVNIRDDMEEVVYRHFSEWGQIDRVRVLNNRGVAFVTYLNECNAQFAKESMAHQSLDDTEVLNVRWATDDPNPMAKVREKRRLEEQAAEAIRKMLPGDFVAELEGKTSKEAKRKKIKDSSFDLEGYEAPDELWYNQTGDSVKRLPERENKEEQPDEDNNKLNENNEIENSEVEFDVGRDSDQAITAKDGLLSESSLDKLHALKESILKNSINPPITSNGKVSALVSGYESD